MNRGVIRDAIQTMETNLAFKRADEVKDVECPHSRRTHALHGVFGGIAFNAIGPYRQGAARASLIGNIHMYVQACAVT